MGLHGKVDNNPRHQCRILDPEAGAAASWTDRDKPLTVTGSDKNGITSTPQKSWTSY